MLIHLPPSIKYQLFRRFYMPALGKNRRTEIIRSNIQTSIKSIAAPIKDINEQLIDDRYKKASTVNKTDFSEEGKIRAIDSAAEIRAINIVAPEMLKAKVQEASELVKLEAHIINYAIQMGNINNQRIQQRAKATQQLAAIDAKTASIEADQNGYSRVLKQASQYNL